MKKFLVRAAILLTIFVSAAAGYFLWIRNRSLQQDEQRVYTAIQESVFPVMYMEMYGEKMNGLHGYSQDMREAVMRDTLTILPEDRNLAIHIEDYDGEITGIYYEIRSLDLERLVENPGRNLGNNRKWSQGRASDTKPSYKGAGVSAELVGYDF